MGEEIMSDWQKKIQKSLQIQGKAKEMIPGVTQLLSKRPDRFSLGVWPGYYSKAKGAEIWDLDGNKYLDMSIGGIGATILGYADPDVDHAVTKAIHTGISSSLNCPEEIELAELLFELHPWAQKVRYARTGGEAMTIAVRIARAFTGRDKIAFCGYHGWHDWYLSANLGNENALSGHLQSGLFPLGVPKALAGTAIPFSYNDAAGLKAIVEDNRDEIAAVVMEPVRNFLPDSDFFPSIVEIIRKEGLLLVLDEISAGFRMNTGGAHLELGVEPDIAVFSKALGNGYPIAAVIGKGEIMVRADSTFISSTNWTEKIGPTAALATIRKHSDLQVGKKLMALGTKVQKGWRSLSKKLDLPIKITGIPPLSHFTFEIEEPEKIRALFIQFMLEQGILASNLFYPMYAHTDNNVTVYLEAMERSFNRIKVSIDQQSVDKILIGKPSVSGFKRMN